MIARKRHSLYFTSPGRVEVREEALPEPGPNEVLVETQRSAISPGSEMLVYRGQFPTGMQVDETITSLSGEFSYPLKYGYSSVGKVTKLGAHVPPFWEGRLVFAFQPHSSAFTAPVDELLPLPEGVAPEDAVFLANMETAVNLVMDGRPLVGEHALVCGQGVVGLLTTALLAQFPLGSLVALERYPLRRQTALQMGAHACLDPFDQEAKDQLAALLPGGADLTFEVSGSPEGLNEAIAHTGFSGRVIVGSWYGSKHASLDLGGRFHRSRVRLISSQVSTLAPELSGRWTKQRRLQATWQQVRKVSPRRLVTHRFPLDKADDAFRLIDQQPEATIQVILTYN